MKEINLMGWPGAGKTRLRNVLAEFSDLTVAELPGLVWSDNAPNLWTVIDARQSMEDVAALQALLKSGQALVFMFWQDTELNHQAWWLRQLKEFVPNTPYITPMYDVIRSADLDKLLASTAIAKSPSWPSLQTFEFELPKVVLEHLLFVLEGARLNLGMEIWRAQGVVETQEYENLVALEMTPNRLDTFAAETAVSGTFRISGIGLDRSSLEEFLNACIAPGADTKPRQ